MGRKEEKVEEDKPMIVKQSHLLDLQYKLGWHTIFEILLFLIAIANDNFWAGMLGWLLIVLNVRFNWRREEEWR